MTNYVFVKLKGNYLSLQEDDETIELTEDKAFATAFPTEVLGELQSAFAEHGITDELEQEPVTEEELKAMQEDDGQVQ
ncbi:MAG: hypothetical protein OXR68_03160 [Alphaproteobacteria bacterium]|nr:hypothetical protein [Alphaproteobacteria bacterium]MDD9919604.1 hypothetical protein [Alphaproteobacteria bacterium]